MQHVIMYNEEKLRLPCLLTEWKTAEHNHSCDFDQSKSAFLANLTAISPTRCRMRNFFLQTSISRLFLDGVATPTITVNQQSVAIRLCSVDKIRTSCDMPK